MHLDHEAFKDYLKSRIYFDPRLNPQSTLNWLDDQLKLLTGKNAKVSDKEYKRILLAGIAPRDHSKPHEHFWFLMYGQMKSIAADRLKLRSSIWEYWSTYQSDDVKTAQSQATSAQQPVLPGSKPTSLFVEEKLCTLCRDNGREKVMKSHNHQDCHFKTLKGHGFPPRSDKAKGTRGKNFSSLAEQVAFLTEAVAKIGNKAGNPYFHDSGCTPKSFTHSKPADFTPKPGLVYHRW